jgi:uncharacterized protein (DUF1810 family)
VAADANRLDRFVTAQDAVIDDVRAELATGTKRTHWMWFVFPQLAALGRSSTALLYGLSSADEARGYWQHPVLGPRLAEACTLLLPHAARGAERVLGPLDALKLRSCLTLFEAAVPEEPLFGRLLEAFYGGERDPATLALLASGRDP